MHEAVDSDTLNISSKGSAQSTELRVPRLVDDAQVPHVAEGLVEVHVVADEEGVGHVEADVVALEAASARAALLQQRRHAHRLAPQAQQVRDQLRHGQARVDDVLHDEHVAALERRDVAHALDFDRARRVVALVALDAHKVEGECGVGLGGKLVVPVHGLGQIREERVRALQHAQQVRAHLAVVLADVARERLHAVLDHAARQHDLVDIRPVVSWDGEQVDVPAEVVRDVKRGAPRCVDLRLLICLRRLLRPASPTLRRNFARLLGHRPRKLRQRVSTAQPLRRLPAHVLPASPIAIARRPRCGGPYGERARTGGL
mmetsp:Transcript_10251/g.35832  ORF Transcript_10251/g.35832 Transcript_10251/m.35832 type:complete len:316 (+) Transcript_10251:105-1052(+)